MQIEAKKVVQKGTHELSFNVRAPYSRPPELQLKLTSCPKRWRVEEPDPKTLGPAPSPPVPAGKKVAKEARSRRSRRSRTPPSMLRLPTIGITATGGWTNANAMSAKVELEDILAAGVKAEFLGTFSPQGGLQRQKGNLFFKNGAFHARAFGEFHPTTGNVTTTVDGVVAHEGFLVGGEAGFDVQKAQLTRYAAAFGYHAPTYSMAVTATNNLKLFSASYYHKVNDAVEAGVKAAYDTKSKSTVGIEVASKYKIDPTSFAKVCVLSSGDGG
jgi:hypothetical protein